MFNGDKSVVHAIRTHAARATAFYIKHGFTQTTKPIMFLIKVLLGICIHATNMDGIALTEITSDCLVYPTAGYKVTRTDPFSAL